jgi:hypothetical protein
MLAFNWRLKIKLDLRNGEIMKQPTSRTFKTNPIPPFIQVIQEIIDDGELMGNIAKRRE